MPLSLTRPRGRWLLVAIASVALIAAGCGGDDNEDASGAPGGVSTPTATVEATDTPAANGSSADDGRVVQGVISGVGTFDWELVRVDRGTKPALILDDGQPVLAYMLERMGNDGFVSVAIGDGDGFTIETVQTGYHYGPLDLELDAAGDLVVAYHNHDWEDAAIARRQGGVWDVTHVEDDGHDGWDTTLAAGPDGALHVLGIDPAQFGGTDGVEYIRLDGGVASVTAIGSGAQPYEWGTDLALDSAGVPHGLLRRRWRRPRLRHPRERRVDDRGGLRQRRRRSLRRNRDRQPGPCTHRVPRL